MNITIQKDDGLIPLKIDDTEVMVDPFEIEETIMKIMSKRNEDGSGRLNSDVIKDFNEYLATIGLPPVTVRAFGIIWVEVEKIIEEFKKKDGWANSTLMTPNSSASTTA